MGTLQTAAEDGKYRKQPIDPRDGKLLKWGTRKEFCTLDEAVASAKRWKLAGVGLFTDGDVGGLDLDHCIEGKALLPPAQRILDKLNTYSECSPSGDGVHALFLRNGSHREESFAPTCQWGNGKSGKCEVYLSRHFITHTGIAFPELRPMQAVSDDVLDWLKAETERLRPTKPSSPQPTRKPPGANRAARVRYVG